MYSDPGMNPAYVAGAHPTAFESGKFITTPEEQLWMRTYCAEIQNSHANVCLSGNVIEIRAHIMAEILRLSIGQMIQKSSAPQ